MLTQNTQVASPISINTRLYQHLPYILATLLAWVLMQYTTFFWDNQLTVSRTALWYNSHAPFKLVPPASLDAGHPPFVALYVASIWKVLGTTLFATRLVFIPFVLMANIALWRLVTHFINHQTNQIIIFSLVIIEPTWLAQSCLYSPDIVLAAGFWVCLYLLVKQKFYWATLPAILMVASSSRGIVLLPILLFIGYIPLVLTQPHTNQKALSQTVKYTFALKYAIPFIIAFSFAGAWLGYHYAITGWLGYDPNSEWAANYLKVPLSGTFRNIGISIWRVIDFGRVTPILALLYLVYSINKTRTTSFTTSIFNLQPDPIIIRLVAWLLLPILAITLLMCRYANPIGHRYFMVAYPAIIILMGYLSQKYPKPNVFYILSGLTFFSFVLGPFIPYPEGVARGADATIAHLPYHHNRKQIVAFAVKNGMPLNNIGSAFPNLDTDRQIALSINNEACHPYNMATDSLIIYSPLYTSFSDTEIATLHNTYYWQTVACYGNNYPKVILLRRNLVTNPILELEVKK